MISYPQSNVVLAALGDKVVDALTAAVARTREDLVTYRAGNPLWVAEASERGLAGWIHDRLWAALVELLHDNPDVHLLESGPTRDVIVSSRYRIRMKRHDISGNVASYPTQGAMEFFAQPSIPTLEGMDQVHLIAGYSWTKDLREIGAAVLSMRDGKNNVIWLVDLDAHAGALAGTTTGGFTPIAPAIDTPVAPVIELAADRDAGVEETS